MSWRSNIINDLIINYLAHQILFSLTFFYGNKLIVDADTETVVDKHNRYNLITSDSWKTLTITLVKKKIQTNHILKLSYLVTTPTREHIAAVEHLARLVKPNNTQLQALNKKCY